ncbi:MAG: DUF835 domain-containing protein, partial [Thaumarchaeota archaeon]|nr:DUF835 domain-containing protein [Nitrososphaerota archaeon]
FLAFTAFAVLWQAAGTYGYTSPDPGIYTARAWWTYLFSYFRTILLYTFIMVFASPKMGRLKYTLVPVYGAAFVQIGMLFLDPKLIFTRPRNTPLGFSAGAGLAAPYLNPYGINLDGVITYGLMIAVLVRRYPFQSHILKGQMRYLIAGVTLSAGARFAFYLSQYLAGISLLPYLSSAGAVAILLGLKKHGFFDITPIAEMRSEIPLRYNLSQGFAYLAFEPEPKQSFEVFSNLALNEYYGLCITRSSPSSIRGTYGLKTTPILWLTEEKSDNALAPSDLHGLLVTIKAFLQKAERSVIMLHGFEYLVSINGFKPVMRLIVRLNDLVLQKNGILLLPVVPGTMNEKQQTFLSAECPSLQRLEVEQSGEAITSPFQPRQELHPLLANAPLTAETHVQEPLQFKREDAEKAFRFLAKAFLQDYTVSRLLIDAAGWRTSLEIAEGASLPARKMYGRDGGPGPAIAELLKRGLVETRWVTGQRGRGGTIMKVRVNNGNPYVKAEVDRLALQP